MNLETLQLGNNKIKSIEGLRHLELLANVSVLDLSGNQIDDPGIVDILERMPKLGVLYMTGNPVVREMRSYRKSLISRLPNLKYLDDRPVFDNERRTTMAWFRGGVDAESKERRKIQEEKKASEKRNIEAFREMQKRALERRVIREQKEEQENKEKSSSEQPESKYSDVGVSQHMIRSMGVEERDEHGNEQEEHEHREKQEQGLTAMKGDVKPEDSLDTPEKQNLITSEQDVRTSGGKQQAENVEKEEQVTSDDLVVLEQKPFWTSPLLQHLQKISRELLFNFDKISKSVQHFASQIYPLEENPEVISLTYIDNTCISVPLRLYDVKACREALALMKDQNEQTNANPFSRELKSLWTTLDVWIYE